MGSLLTIVNAPHAHACATAAETAAQRLAADARVALILPSRSAIQRAQQHLADRGIPTLGIEVTTLRRWALDRWALYGDGRAPVSAAERRAACLAVLSTPEAPRSWRDQPGMVACLEAVVQAASGSRAFEGADADDPRLSAAEQKLLAACRSYAALLKTRGFIEPGEAMALLPEAMGAAGWPHLVLQEPRKLLDAEMRLVIAAAHHGGAALIAQLGKNPAFEASRDLCERLAGQCQAAGVAVERVSLPADAGSPWLSDEIALLSERLFMPPGSEPVAPQGSVRFCLPAGRYAEPELVARTLRGLVEEGVAPRHIAVACRRPLELAAAVSSRTAEGVGRAVGCTARGDVPIASTSTGRLLSALETLVRTEHEQPETPVPHLRSVAADAARDPLAGLATQDALALDCAWRKNRAARAADFLEDLVNASLHPEPPSQGPDFFDPPQKPQPPLTTWAALAHALGAPSRAKQPEAAPPTPLAQAVEALRAGDLAQAAEALAAPLGTPGVDDRRERAAAAAVARLARAAQTFADPSQPLPALEQLIAGQTVAISWAAVPRNDVAAQAQASVLASSPNAVEFCTLPQLQGRSFDAVVVCDLTAEAFSVADRQDAQGVFLANLGCSNGPSALQELRRQLRGALESARSRIVFERCLQDPEAKDLRPSALFEEVVDCYRTDRTSPHDLDRSTGLPKDGRLPCTTLGEERFAELASPLVWTPATTPVVSSGLEPANPRVLERLTRPDRPWSPAELELYLRCPLRWFYERQVPSDTIDASFGPREMGNFSRQVLRSFHEALAALDRPRVAGQDDRTIWEPVLDECFAKILASQEGSGNSLVPTTHLERERLETVRRDLRSCVERDALLPPGFLPRRHEWSFGKQDPLVYGGVRLQGTVDRIDEDAAGRALVIDYKGAFGNGYGVPRPKRGQDPQTVDPLPLHSQALMYASALQRARPSVRAVGAIYVSYNRIRAQGFLDGTVTALIASENAYLDAKNLVEPAADGSSGFQTLLSYVEGEVSEAMDRLRDGDVAARPRFGKDSCAYCTVAGCPKRRTA